ncbi:MAG: porin [Stappiaceae bacterium]
MTLKSILLGTAAGTMAITGASAADLPVAPEPVDYVRVCDVHGTGFFYIPGTETCLQVGGDVRSRYTYNDVNANSRAGSPSDWSARGRIWLDARNESEWGSIRTYIRYTASTTASGAAGGGAELDRAFIQVGNFVTGYASSFMNLTYGAYAINNVYGTFDSDETTWLAGYTFDLGNGAYLAASVEAPERDGILDIGGGDGTYGGTTWPDAGFNLGIDQGWGSAGIVAGIHQVRPASATGVGLDSNVGWFVGAGAEFNILSTTKIGGTAFYGDGMMSRLGLGDRAVDAVVSGTSVDNTTAWTASLGITHDFNSEVSVSLNGSYFDVDHGFAAPDPSGWMVGASAEYTPLSGLTFGVGVEYIDIEDPIPGDEELDDGAYAITLQVVRSF